MVSASACAFPLIATKFPQLRIPPAFLFFVRHFGTGVLLATAFAHLLPTAFLSLTDPCLPPIWTDDYPAMTGVIALAAVFLVATIEMIFSPGRKACSASLAGIANSCVARPKQEDPNIENLPSNSPNISTPRLSTNAPGPYYGGYGAGRADSIGQHLPRVTERAATTLAKEEDNHTNQRGQGDGADLCIDRHSSSATTSEKDSHRVDEVEAFHQNTPISPEQKRQKDLLQCILLEVGILFHSVFIGMALAVAVGNDFIVLIIAISFHQTFEGLALGSRIAAVGWPAKAWQPWLMALAYGCTTPLGQVIGIATHTLYAPDSMTGLLMVGIMNAISSGLLIFTSLIDLLGEDFLSDESWRTLRGRKRLIACGLVCFGAIGMSVIGAWA